MSEKNSKDPENSKIDDNAEIKTCFIIMPIADSPGYTTGHFKRVYDYIIKPACLKAGFEPIRADDVKSANYIMIDILKRILNADMAICDVSARNPNVLYELGLRQAFDYPVTLIKDDITIDSFDIQGIRYITYDNHLRIDLVTKVIDELAESILETYEKRDKDIFSLVQILGRERATPKPSEVAPDTLMLLEAINELRENMKQNSVDRIGSNQDKSSNNSKIYSTIEGADISSSIKDKNLFMLQNGQVVEIGDYITHEKLGRGVIAGGVRNGSESKLIIDFDNFGEKHLIASLAKLRRLE